MENADQRSSCISAVLSAGSPIGSGGLPTNLTVDQIPFQDWARALYEYPRTRGGLDDPHVRCQPAGGMRFFTVPNGMEIIDQPELNRIFIIGGENRNWRRIAMEPGRRHPVEEYFCVDNERDAVEFAGK